jgi:hypothetical protein
MQRMNAAPAAGRRGALHASTKLSETKPRLSRRAPRVSAAAAASDASSSSLCAPDAGVVSRRAGLAAALSAVVLAPLGARLPAQAATPKKARRAHHVHGCLRTPDPATPEPCRRSPLHDIAALPPPPRPPTQSPSLPMLTLRPAKTSPLKKTLPTTTARCTWI